MSQILAGLPNTVLALVGIGLTLFIAKDKLGLEDKYFTALNYIEAAKNHYKVTGGRIGI
tara:strand:+ start:736 stop:912 length:177 start_codon:yes stop_codon:yes gene_type:complete